MVRPVVLASSLALSLAGSLALSLCAPRSASAYPTSVVAVPNAEVVTFADVSTAFSAYFRFAPQPVDFSAGWVGIDFGVAPSLKLAKSPAGDIEIGGIEAGFDLFGPDENGRAAFELNFKAQLLHETDYLPGIAVGMFQISPDARSSALLGYFVLSKAFSVREINLGQVTLGMMSSFAGRGLVAPGCNSPGGKACLFRGAAPFEDKNAALLLGYRAPWFGPVTIGIDHLGGTSAVSSTNAAVIVRIVPEVFYLTGGVYFGNDRRASPPGPGSVDGFFVTASLYGTLLRLVNAMTPAKKPAEPPAKGKPGEPPDDRPEVSPSGNYPIEQRPSTDPPEQ
jgi:hypothetical protein